MADATKPLEGAAVFWDREVTSHTHSSWMENIPVREHINRRISGRSGGWPLDWLQEILDQLRPSTSGRPRFRRGLSIGCGTGPLERDLVKRGLVESVDAFDGSLVSVETARELARTAGYADRIRYFIADFNQPPLLPRGQYDIVFFHQSLHHVWKIEKLMRTVRRAMTRHALLYLDEYIGPSRFEWSDRMIAPHRQVYARVPAELRKSRELQLPIQEDDPSEALRSSEIMRNVRCGFDTLFERPYGGSLLSVLYPQIDWQKAPAELIGLLIRSEEELLSAGTLPEYHAIVVGRPKRGIRGAVADLEYAVRPKLRRLWWEIRQKVTKEQVPY